MRDLKTTLGGILLASVAACKTPTAPSPTTSPTTTPIGTTNWQASAVGESLDCPALQSLDDVYRELPWASGVDGISFYSMIADEDAKADGVTQSATLGYVHGTPCKDQACEAKRNQVAQAFMSQPDKDDAWVYLWAPQHRAGKLGFAVVSRGGTHTLVATYAGLRSLLAPLTTVKHAQAWAIIDQSGLGCRVDPAKDIAVGTTWFDLRTQNTQCIEDANGKAFDVTYDVVYRVHADAKVEALPPREVARQPSVHGCIMVGRRPVAMAENRAVPSEFAALLAETAALEAAAIVAFDELASSLRQFGAPADLIARAQVAKADEVRHAAVMSAHAMHYGWDVSLPATVERAAAPSYASLFDLALHNAREGCINETYGAMVAMHQAQNAHDAELRSSLAQIADDEVSHAQWSHDVDAWLQSQLSSEQQQAVAAAKASALVELAALAHAPISAAQLRAGVPSAQVSAQLVARMASL